MSGSRKLLVAALVLFFVAGVVTVAFAQVKTGEKAPKVVIGNKTAAIGDVLEGQDVFYTFKIKNGGSADLQILSVRPG
jgi:hypothetical protein